MTPPPFVFLAGTPAPPATRYTEPPRVLTKAEEAEVDETPRPAPRSCSYIASTRRLASGLLKGLT